MHHRNNRDFQKMVNEIVNQMNRLRDLQVDIKKSAARQGFAIQHVLPTPGEPGFTYTIGLHRSGTDIPELFISGMKPLIANMWLFSLAFEMLGPPVPEVQERMAAEQGITVSALRFPPGGKRFALGVRYTGLAENNLSACFGEVDQDAYEDYFGQAIRFHKGTSFPVLQLVWPDTNNVFPFEPHFEARFKDRQQLLFDPQEYLPLKNEE